jgi:hypothetical protein
MPLSKNIKKLFRRRGKPQSGLQSNVESTIRRANRPGPEGKGTSNTTSQGTEVGTEVSASSLLHPEEISVSRDSIPRDESLVKEDAIIEEEASSLSEADPMASRRVDRLATYAGARSESGGATDDSLDEVSPLPSDRRQSVNSMTSVGSDINRDPPEIAASYNAIPLLEQTILPRGGISMDTQAVGRVQVCSCSHFFVHTRSFSFSKSNFLLDTSSPILVWYSARNH